MEHVIVIKKLIAGGKGLGTLADGMVIMVPGVAAGETVLVRETRSHRGHKEAQLLRVIEASPDRIEPPCPHYGSCGGCDLQHLSLQGQLESKQRILAEALNRVRLELPPGQPDPTLPSPSAFAYRHRLRLHLGPDGQLGFHQTASNQIVPIRRCLLATEPINQVIAGLIDSEWAARLGPQCTGVELIHGPAHGGIVLVLHQGTSQLAALKNALLQNLAPLVRRVIIRQAKPGRNSPQTSPQEPLSQLFTLGSHAYRLDWDALCFFQVNASQNPRLIAAALAPLTTRTTPFSALDLFCGMGNFSIPLGLMGALVTGIEHNRHSISWAKQNALMANISQARFIAADVEQQVRLLVDQDQRFDCILLDPPRQGLGNAAALLPRLKPQIILSISCDPATQARDLSLIAKGGYRISRVLPVDMFPQTHHIESIAFLERI